MKKNNKFQLHPKTKKLILNVPNNVDKMNSAIADIISASRRPKNPVYKGLIDLKIVSVQADTVIIESDEELGCTHAWKQNFGKILAENYGLGIYCYVNPNSSNRRLFN